MSALLLPFQQLLMLSLCLRSVAHAASNSTRKSVPLSQLITSSCLSDLECTSNEYCDPPDFGFDVYKVVYKASTCSKRMSAGSSCTSVGASQCANGSFCGFLEDFSPEPLSCVLQKSAGESCALSATFPCKPPLVCEIKPVCREFNFGFAEHSCQFDRHCQQNKGFYCRSNLGKCAKKKSPGAECGRGSDNFECNGFCVGPENFDDGGVCQRRQVAGERCNDDRQCSQLFVSRQEEDDILCNRPTSTEGICVLKSELLGELGANCDPKADKCDTRRGLSCGLVDDKYRCVQRGLSPEQTHYCTPFSKFSSCTPSWSGNPRECRRAFSFSNPRSKRMDGVFVCLNVRERMRIGQPCNAEFAVCEKGAVCSVVPGVTRFGGKFPRPPFRSCRKIVADGENCSDPFRTICKNSSFCVNGKCERTDTDPPKLSLTHSALGQSCAELKCPPFSVCRTTESTTFKTCQLPMLEVGLRYPCGASAKFELKCKKGLTCSRDNRGEGTRVCRLKRDIGELCEDDDSCKTGLKCDPSFLALPFKKVCYDPELSLKLGDECSPSPGKKDLRCVAEVQISPDGMFIKNIFSLSCLPKNGKHICQKASDLFRKCSLKNNTGCANDDLVCSKFGVCIPSSQA